MKNMRISIYSAFLVLLLSCTNDSKLDKRPNILFVISDDQSHLHTSFSGSTYINTPGFDRIAKEGIYFSNCYAGSPGCAPSRSSIVTGRYPWQNEQSGQHASSWLKKYVPFVDEIQSNGYAVGRSGKGVAPFRYARNEADSLWRVGDAAGPLFASVKYDDKNDERTASGEDLEDYANNFKNFLQEHKGDKPFFYWFGAREPHRVFEKGSWKKNGKKLDDVDVPAFLPDNDEVRGDLLDYAVEIEWFDLHLRRMIKYLEEIGELENTIIIVTSDNGMDFPRAKANCYEYGVHVPFAIRFPKQIKGNQICKTPISFIDIAPTILEVTETKPQQMMPITGKSMWELFTSGKSNQEQAVFSGRERHTSARYNNLGYPQRCVRKGDYLFIWNMKPGRYPVGAPIMYKNKSTELTPLYGLDESGKFVYDGVFADIGPSPTKSNIIENYNTKDGSEFFHSVTDKRPEFELYNVVDDEYCLNNLVRNQKFTSIGNELKQELQNELKRTNDPRLVGPNSDIFDAYKRYMVIRKFPDPSNDKL
jgi:N-sulfoglucosamine sulfohydrolase